MNYSNIAQLQAQILSSISTIEELESVYSIETSNPSGYPYATVTFGGMNSDEVRTQVANMFSTKTSIKIFDEINGEIESRVNTEVRLLSILDAALDLIRNTNYSSIGYGFKPLITVAEPQYIKSTNGIIREIEITVELKEKISVSFGNG